MSVYENACVCCWGRGTDGNGWWVGADDIMLKRYIMCMCVGYEYSYPTHIHIIYLFCVLREMKLNPCQNCVDFQVHRTMNI